MLLFCSNSYRWPQSLKGYLSLPASYSWLLNGQLDLTYLTSQAFCLDLLAHGFCLGDLFLFRLLLATVQLFEAECQGRRPVFAKMGAGREFSARLNFLYFS
jgi:hypothetical protein